MTENTPLWYKDRDADMFLGHFSGPHSLTPKARDSGADNMHLLFKSSVSKVAIVNPDNAIILMKEFFLFSFTTFLQSLY